ncbi:MULTISPECIES: lipocalin family protein [Galbibacter]|uniref:Lipocalin-like domain-containing protein n=1 Tax=Galbibacter orientalis DSM 19592 TaxID=926559 RepID=I3C6K1_9FLAO|nr:lipocalin family protein [Galbibacter orientalis]EIJ39244.1 hypothetical protein JoomaDRAFT_2256 [Galbibacter orientalis DSM 19592]
MKIRVLIILCSIFLSCNKTQIEDISLLNGYWEIEKVTFPSGENKDYKVNTVIDYWQLKDSTGTKEKVMPRLDGRFLNMKEFENFSIKKENDGLYIEYNNDGNVRKEKIILLTKDRFGIVNSQDKTYYYKRFEKFSLK